MKKNNMMRIASVLLVAVLLSTSAISATFAKYTTSADATDTARVAKWGVTVAVAGDAFDTEYDLKEAVDGLTLAVESTEKVVAPGTSGEFTGVTLSGIPEVAVKVIKTATVTLTGWEIDTGFYCPLVVNGVKGTDYDNAADFKAAIEASIAKTAVYNPGTDLSAVAETGSFAWSWAFDGDDVKDTKLGDLETAPEITIAVEVEVTQVD